MHTIQLSFISSSILGICQGWERAFLPKCGTRKHSFMSTEHGLGELENMAWAPITRALLSLPQLPLAGIDGQGSGNPCWEESSALGGSHLEGASDS